MDNRATERLWSNQEAILLRRPQGGYLWTCTAGRAAFLTDEDARRLARALVSKDASPDDTPDPSVVAVTQVLSPEPTTAEILGAPHVFTAEPVYGRNKPKSRKPPRRPAHRKAPPRPTPLVSPPLT